MLAATEQRERVGCLSAEWCPALDETTSTHQTKLVPRVTDAPSVTLKGARLADRPQDFHGGPWRSFANSGRV